MQYRSLRLDGVPPKRSERHAPDFLVLPARTSKPRRAGITHVLDRGLSPLAPLLETLARSTAALRAADAEFGHPATATDRTDHTAHADHADHAANDGRG